MALKKILTPVSDALDKVCSVLIVIMLGLMVLITTAQIIWRTWFTAITWSDEVTRYLLIWSTFLGASVVYRHSGHISVSIVQDKLPANTGRVLRIAVHAICFVLFTVLLVYSSRYCTKLTKTATTLPIKMKYVYLCVPISMAIMMVHSLTMGLEEFLTPAEKEVKA